MKLLKSCYLCVILLLVFLVFKAWFTTQLLSGGDLQVYYKEMFINFSFFPPPSWSWTLGAGLGVNSSSLLWNYVVVQAPIALFGNVFGFPWQVIQRVGYLFPYLILSVVLPYFYGRKLFSAPYTVLATILFSFNTYILMLVSGGQIFLSLAYVIIPPVCYYFYLLLTERKIARSSVKTICICALLFALQVLFDLRIAYTTLALILLFAAVNAVINKKYKTLLFLPIVLGITGLLHAFWLLPTILVRQNPLASFGEEFVSSGIVKFLSFATFENTISLLQPNWPENIFGKVYFMRPEFLVFPILAFSSLLFVKNEKKEVRLGILFFALAGLIGAFLAKGTNEPFGGVYSLLFTYVPGFMMFRDPTKWYALVAISYSVLIPYSVAKIYGSLGGYKKFSIFNFQFSTNLKNKIFNLQNLFIILTTLYLLLLITPAWMGQLGGVLRGSTVPADYEKLEQFISKDTQFYRTFWVPRTSTYSFYSVIHPITTGYDFTREYSASEIIKTMSAPGFETTLQDISVKYVIIPYDSDSKIFLKDRKYDDLQYRKAVAQLRNVSYLREVPGFGKIKVFEVTAPHAHIWSSKPGLISSFVFKNPTLYEVDVKGAKKGDIIVLSENYDKNWIARGKNIKFQISNFKYPIAKTRSLNAFVLPKDGDYSFEIYYTVQDWVNVGTVISGATLLGVLLVLGWSYKKRK